MLNPNPDEEGAENLGGSTLVNGLAVFLRFRIPTRFLVGDRPAGALNGLLLIVVLSFLIGERASRIGRRGEERDVDVEAGALVRKKLVGLVKEAVSFDEPSRALDRFGERKMTGSMFSESLVLSKSKDSALRFGGEVRFEVIAV